MNTNLVFPFLLTHIFLDERLSVISKVDYFMTMYKTTDLRLIRDHSFPISKNLGPHFFRKPSRIVGIRL